MKTLFISIDNPNNRQRLLTHMKAARNVNWDIFLFTVSGKDGAASLNMDGVVVKKIRLAFRRGPLMFLQFNLSLFCHLLFNKYNVVYSRGIWAFPGIFFLSRKTKLIFDAHEYFPGLEVFKLSWLKRKIWLWFEKVVAKRASVMITVSSPILNMYNALYPQIKSKILVHNIPESSSEINLPNSYKLNFKKPVILFHGLFMPSRGLKNLIQAMEFIDDGVLLLVGEGVLNAELKELSKQLNLQGKVFFRPMVPNILLIEFAKQATVGVSLLEPVSLNHKFALPNKFFEYIHAGLPVIVSEDTTLAEYVGMYNIGLTANPGSPKDIAEKINIILADKALLVNFKAECEKLAKTINYNSEIQKLVSAFKELGN